MASVTLSNVVKRYGKTGQAAIIHGIDLDIRDGEFMVFVGPSGCGKSTLLRMIAGLEALSEGELHIDGRLANHVPPAERGVAMVFQSYALYPHMSVFENMAFSLQLAGRGKRDIEDAVHRAADILQIGSLLARKPGELSGGQRQRVAIGRAIVRRPEVFLFDEPLSNLDAGLRVQMRVELSRLHRELKTTMIYVTHDQVEAMTLGERIAVFNAGRIEQVGSPLELYDNPANLFVAGFLGSPKMNFLPGEVVSAGEAALTVRLAGGALITATVNGGGAQVGASVTLGVRAEHLEPAATDAGSANAIAACVRHVEHLGDASIAYAELPQIEPLIAIRLPHGGSTKAGDVLALRIPGDRCQVFDTDGHAFARRDAVGTELPTWDKASLHGL